MQKQTLNLGIFGGLRKRRTKAESFGGFDCCAKFFVL